VATAPANDRRYAPAYREEISLADGTRVSIRALGPGDEALLQRHFDRLSPRSRYQRFLGGKSGLTARELDFLVHPDWATHVALVAVLADRPDEPLGIARFVRVPEDPAVAEPALAVVDSMQSHGLGRQLIARLVEAARERGIERLRWVMLQENGPIRHLVGALGPPLRVIPREATLTMETATGNCRRLA